MSESTSGRAKALSKNDKARILEGIAETDLHYALASLFEIMEPEYWTEVTHGVREFGKDLVLVRHGSLDTDVTAVVVKRGKISGTTSGEVDEIKARVRAVRASTGDPKLLEILSQVSQAREIPATLKTHFQDLPVNKVFVVHAGQMSQGARERLTGELKLGDKFFDLQWLVEKFTKHYPQVFFDPHAYDFIEAQIAVLESDSLLARANKTLSECFVEPVMVRVDEAMPKDEDPLQWALRRPKIRLEDLAAPIRERKHILILGDPGNGKSKAVAKYCIDEYRRAEVLLARSDKSQVVPVPLLLTAVELASLPGDPTDELRGRIPADAKARLRIDVLVVDALDEVPAPKREETLDRARRAANDLKAALIVTSRRLALLENPTTGLRRYEMLPLELSQAMRFVKRVSTSASTLGALKSGLQQLHAQLPLNPLSLILLIQVVEERKEVPASVTELYDRYFDMVLGRWDEQKGIAALFEYVVKKSFLAALAQTEFYLKDRLEISRPEFDSFCSAHCDRFGWDQEQLGDFLKELERSGALQIGDEVFFRHRSFVDYFAAFHLSENRSEIPDLAATVSSIYFDPFWAEIAFYYVGLQRKLTGQVLDRIQKHEGDSLTDSAARALVGRLLQAGWNSERKIKQSGIAFAAKSFDVFARGLQDYVKSIGSRSSPLLTDLNLLAFAELSFGSTFVEIEVREALAAPRETDEPEFEFMLRRVALAWAARRFLSTDKRRAIAEGIANDVKGTGLSAAHKTRVLVGVGMMNSDDQQTIKAIQRQLRRLNKRSRGNVAALLPAGLVSHTQRSARRKK